MYMIYIYIYTHIIYLYLAVYIPLYHSQYQSYSLSASSFNDVFLSNLPRIPLLFPSSIHNPLSQHVQLRLR